MSIDNFKAEVANLARPTLFEVESTDLGQEMKFLCKAASLPSSTLGLVEVPYLGRKVKVAGDRTFEDWEITIQQDESFSIRKKLEDWSNQINDHNLNVGPANTSAYKKDMKVRQLGVDGGVLAEYKMVGCWPQVVAAVDLAFDSNDTVLEFGCTISYDYWTRLA